jgi:sulfite reductase (NADPH) hemoprotein beta-component
VLLIGAALLLLLPYALAPLYRVVDPVSTLEIGLVGRGSGRYNLYLGAAFDGSRLGKLYAEDLDHEAIIAKLDLLFAAYAAERQAGERFGAFVIRAGFVAQTANGADFHANTGPQRHV